MKTGQTAPAFQFYASDVIADKRYRSMSLEERGLFLSLMCECWVNKSVPVDPEKLGQWLGFPATAIKSAMTEQVLSFFQSQQSEFISPELEKYRLELQTARQKMSKAGKEGAQIREEKKRAALLQQGHPQGHPQGSRVEMNRDEMNRGESLKKEDSSIDDDWVRKYEDAQFDRL